MPKTIDPSLELVLLEYQDNKLYGELVVKYEGGRVVLMKRTETIKPGNGDRNNRSED